MGEALVEMSDRYDLIGRKMRYVSTFLGKRSDCDEEDDARDDEDENHQKQSVRENRMMSCRQGMSKTFGILVFFGIAVNPYNFASYDEAYKTFKEMEVHRHSLLTGCASTKGIVAHEFGHAVHRQIVLRMTAKEEKKMNRKLIWLRYKSIITSFLSGDGNYRYHFSVDNSEAFADAFSAIMYGDEKSRGHPITRYVRSVMEENKQLLSLYPER